MIYDFNAIDDKLTISNKIVKDFKGTRCIIISNNKLLYDGKIKEEIVLENLMLERGDVIDLYVYVDGLCRFFMKTYYSFSRFVFNTDSVNLYRTDFFNKVFEEIK